MLARTEIYTREEPAEEDNYIAALEWADSLGADIVCTALGYNTWDNPFLYPDRVYTVNDVDGVTARITIAADIAVEKGVTVITAMANERASSGIKEWNGKMLLPADGFGVISVGASTELSGPPFHVAGFASIGPTADGRIKPDVSAPGASVVMIQPGTTTGYRGDIGTSFATPIVAGVAAQLLQAHPDWGPADIATALRFSGHQASLPDTLLGWGVIDGLLALDAHKGLLGQVIGENAVDRTATISVSGGGIDTTFYTNSTGWFRLIGVPVGEHTVTATMAGFDTESVAVTTGNRPTQIAIPLTELENRVASIMKPKGVHSVSASPNPANPGNRLAYRMPSADVVGVLSLFDLTGQVVRSWRLGAGRIGSVDWDGRDRDGRAVASGYYLVRLRTGQGSAVTSVSVSR